MAEERGEGEGSGEDGTERRKAKQNKTKKKRKKKRVVDVQQRTHKHTNREPNIFIVRMDTCEQGRSQSTVPFLSEISRLRKIGFFGFGCGVTVSSPVCATSVAQALQECCTSVDSSSVLS